MNAGKIASILVTDDESSIRLLLRTALETEGYFVCEAADGRAALEAVRRSQPDLMVLDMNMPVMDGMAVLEQMKELAAEHHPRVIVLTAYGSIPTAVRATRLGAADFLEKPLTPQDLRSAVRGVLEEPLEVPGADRPQPPGGYEYVLEKVRKALRLMDLADAESLLVKAAEVRDQHSAAYFNLLGILYESQHRWRLARRCYGKATVADADYEPAKTNLRRLADFHYMGRSDQRVMLGDEPEGSWLARLPPRAD